MADNEAKPITVLYPAHTTALNKAKILPKHIPMIRELKAREVEHQKKQCKVHETKEERKDNQKICFVLGHTRHYTNLQEKFHGDLISK
eukprot:12854239-Ditylum_brightwellii.AAC.1